MIRNSKLGATLAVALSAALTIGIAPTAAFAAPEPANEPGTSQTTSADESQVRTEIDFLAEAYDGLDEGHVFESATYERLSRLLDVEEGENYAIVLAGPQHSSAQAALPEIQRVAEQYDVPRIYHFDPQLDGDAASRLDITRTDSDIASAWRQLWSHTNGSGIKDKLANLDPSYTSDSTYLLVYNKSASPKLISGVISTTGAFDETSAQVYRDQVAAVFDAVADPVSGKADIEEHPFFDYYRNRINGIPATANANVGIPPEAREGFTIETITYPNLIHLLQSEGDFAILFGGTWCPYTTPTANIANTYAKKNGVKKIYQFDFRLDGNSSSRQIRSNNNPFGYLYGKIVNEYLTNLELEPSAATLNYVKPGEEQTRTVKQIGVPFFFQYDKDNTDALGEPAPVAGEWIGWAPQRGQHFAYAWYQAADVRQFLDDPAYYVKEIGRPVDPDVDSVERSSDGDRSVSLALPALDQFFADISAKRASYDPWTDTSTAPVTDDSVLDELGGCGDPNAVVSYERQEKILGQNGNNGYDVSHYDISAVYSEPHAGALAGSLKVTTAVSATATGELPSIRFDLREVDVSSVLVDGKTAPFELLGDDETDTHKLVIAPATAIPDGAEFTVEVTHRTFTNSYLFNGTTTQGFVPSGNGNGATAIGEPNGPSFWFPSNNTTLDRATFDVKLTAPNSLVGVSIGDLASKAVHGTTTTRHWKLEDETIPYTVFASFGDYVEFEGEVELSDGRKIPSYSYVDRSLYNSSPSVKAKAYHYAENLQQYIRWTESVAGSYPYDSVGFVFENLSDGPNDVTWSLETAARPVFAGIPNDQLVVHELLHQWFGNSVSIASWEDLWLNEGIVTYLSNHYLTDTGRASGTAVGAYRGWFPSNSDLEFWSIAPADPLNVKNIFGNATYGRGSYATAALHVLLGEEDFFEVLKEWVVSRSGGSGSTADFVALAEQRADVDLGDFSATWLYGQAKPASFPEKPLRKLSDPIVAPTAPGTPRVVLTGTSAKVEWTAPEANEDAPVTGYRVTLALGDESVAEATTDAATLTHTFPSLNAGTYRVSVRAFNESGQSTAAATDFRVAADAAQPVDAVVSVKAAKPSVRYGSANTARVTVRADGSPATGEVKVSYAGKTIAAKSKLSNGATTVTLPKTTKPGNRTLTVSYLGNDSVNPATAKATVKVLKAKTTVGAKLAKKSVKASQRGRIVVNAKLGGASGVHPTGKVQVLRGSKVIKTVTLKASQKGKATVTLPKLKKGTHKLRVKLPSSSTQQAVTSKRITLKVR